jgi:hypothetical protein
MRFSDWQKMHLHEDVRREPTHDYKRIVVWLRRGAERGLARWERVGNVLGTESYATRDLCAAGATSVRATIRVRGFLAKLFGGRKQQPAPQTWFLPTGEVAEQEGEMQTDLLLVWAEDENTALDEAQVRSQWPEAKQFRICRCWSIVLATATRVSC